MDNKTKLEELLHQRTELLSKIKEQDAFLMELNAFKRTFVKALVKEDLYVGLPLSNYEQTTNFEAVRIEDEYPLYILNIGEVHNIKQSVIPQKYTVPVNFRALRYYKKSKINKKTRDFTWYTTTILNKNEEAYFIIRDDENNSWKGCDIFDQFCQSFDHRLAFNSIEEWLGLDKDEVQAMACNLNNQNAFLKTKEKEGTLDEYFVSK
ncbi:uncharacterized protein VICG_00046 [Vittaforma corneae ATCC 50505]|uniref:FYR N-terminal domain-containing protein n=1 Tax=Vittaforma corneae (strain ATCC 50505) TaxID=993615 RepID=L2GPH4_VITCO|nr:uncharacterized protein VICG_00046 [Vittaforma corneae ATCC 50505]ELA42731.1 hypothetical protein VICG_00046 [Vittaforma corneae ATCC 50505]